MEKILEKILSLLPPVHVPNWLLWLCLGMFLFWAFSKLLSEVVKAWKDDILPRFYNAEERLRVSKRRRFANYIERIIREINNSSEWYDFRFTDLEAEVELDEQPNLSLLFFGGRNHKGLRREESVSKALAGSHSRTILLEGSPGSGKSVALRHVVQNLAIQATKSWNARKVIPIYVDLRRLDHVPDKLIDSSLIYAFILESLRIINDREVDRFLEEEFDRGIQEGTWLFVFDSFDEIPEILSSTDADIIIKQYAKAISDFLGGMNQCRGIVASRHFNGPNYTDWSKLRILPLSEVRYRKLIHKHELNPAMERELLQRIVSSDNPLNNFIDNPLFLSLLCDHMKANKTFPENAHSVFESYIETRLKRDESKLYHRFALKPDQLRTTAEQIAFAITADNIMGLNPTVDRLRSALIDQHFTLEYDLEIYLDALEFIQLAQRQPEGPDKIHHFTFVHRRFQEYFATCLVLREPERISPENLLFDSKWRETAVTMCQTQPFKSLSPFLNETQRFFNNALSSSLELTEILNKISDKSTLQNKDDHSPKPFPWPEYTLHVLLLLQDGFSNRLDCLIDDVRNPATLLITSAFDSGTLLDKKLATEVSGFLPQRTLLPLLNAAFASTSQWLMEIAYRQVASLDYIPEEVEESLRQVLVRLALSARLHKQRLTTEAYLHRLKGVKSLLAVHRLLVFAPFIECSLIIMCISLIWLTTWGHSLALIYREFISLAILLHAFFLIRATTARFRYGVRQFGRALGDMAISMLFIRLIFPLGFVSMFSTFMFMPLSIFLLYCYSVVWLPLALVATQRGDFVHPIWWPFMPITILLRGIKSFLNWISNSKKGKLHDPSEGLNILDIFVFLVKDAATGLVGLLLLLVVIFLLSKLPHSESVMRVFADVMLVVLLCFVLMIVAAYLSNIYDSITDHRRLRNWIKQDNDIMTVAQLQNELKLYKTPISSLAMIKEVRSRGLLEASYKAELFLLRFADDVEHAQRKYKYSRLREITSIPIQESTSHTLNQYDTWLNEYKGNGTMRLALLDSEFIDELYRIVEQIRGVKTQSATLTMAE